MRTLVDIPDNQIEELNQISKEESLPRTEIIRRAVTAYISMHRQSQEVAGQDPIEAVRGLWKDRNIDGVEYQREARAEWDR